MDNNKVVINFNDVAEISATREVLEDILSTDFIKNNLSIYDYQRIKDLIKYFRLEGSIGNDNSFFYKNHEFVLVKGHSTSISDRVVCFMKSIKQDLLIPWYSENTDIIEAGKMPPDDLLIVIDNYLNK